MTITEMAEQIHIQAMGAYIGTNNPVEIENIKGLSAVVAVKAISSAQAFYTAELALHQEEEDKT